MIDTATLLAAFNFRDGDNTNSDRDNFYPASEAFVRVLFLGSPKT